MDITGEVLQVAHQFLKKVRRSGPDNVMAVCPFHLKPDGTEERTPSFAMSLTKGLYFCHACKTKGNLFSFLRDIGLTRDIIERQYRFLIEAAAKNLPPPPDPLRCKVWDIPPIEEGVLGLFDYCPTRLIQQGFQERTLHHFEVGFDQWHNRITFPLRDLKGSLVGISGRANDDSMEIRHKVYTKEYELWRLPARAEVDKRFILWNAHRLYPEVYYRSPGETAIVVVEGFKAAMWLWQVGMTNVVALLGSYLSWEQQWILERLGATVYLFLDNNYAGRNGTINAADALRRSLNVRIIEYPERLIEDEDAQPDGCSPDEAIEQMAIAPTYLSWLLKHTDQRVH
jgi:DNA primase